MEISIHTLKPIAIRTLALGILFFRVIFADLVDSADAEQYIAGIDHQPLSGKLWPHNRQWPKP